MFLKNARGLTLIEIMVVVVIIGLLAVIATPKYLHSVNVSKQKEAKANLASLAAAMKTFWSEYATYTSHLNTIGYNPEGNLIYGYGFSANQNLPASLDTVAPNYDPTDTNCNKTYTGGANGYPTCTAGSYVPKWTSEVTARNNFSGNSFPVNNTWIAYARANFNGGQDDEWSIDSQDKLTNTSSGL